MHLKQCVKPEHRKVTKDEIWGIDWFRAYHHLPGVFAGEGEVKAAQDAYPGNRTNGDEVQAFADHGAITARVSAGIEGMAPDMPEIDDLIDREPETPEELHAWLDGDLEGYQPN